MEYQVLFKQYKNSTPVKEECWKLDPTKKEQWKELEQFPCRIQCIRKNEVKWQYFFLRAELIHYMEQPISMSLEFVPEEWNRREYVFMPGAVYDGNRMDSKRISYPPFYAGKTEKGWEQVITDIPHLDKGGKDSRIQFRSGDMSTPAMGYFNEEQDFIQLLKLCLMMRE